MTEEAKAYQKEYKKKYYEAHKTEVLAHMKKYNKAHRTKMKAYQKAYKAAHKAELKAYHKAYEAAHRDEVKAYQKEYRAAHKAEVKAYMEKYYEDNKAEVIAYIAAHQRQHYCCEEISEIENYNLAKADNFIKWDIHHRLETNNSDGERRLVDITSKELMKLGMYYNRPASELIFMKHGDHVALHNKGKKKR